jgi:hypothetical protein
MRSFIMAAVLPLVFAAGGGIDADGGARNLNRCEEHSGHPSPRSGSPDRDAPAVYHTSEGTTAS